VAFIGKYGPPRLFLVDHEELEQKFASEYSPSTPTKGFPVDIKLAPAFRTVASPNVRLPSYDFTNLAEFRRVTMAMVLHRIHKERRRLNKSLISDTSMEVETDITANESDDSDEESCKDFEPFQSPPSQDHNADQSETLATAEGETLMRARVKLAVSLWYLFCALIPANDTYTLHIEQTEGVNLDYAQNRKILIRIFQAGMNLYVCAICGVKQEYDGEDTLHSEYCFMGRAHFKYITKKWWCWTSGNITCHVSYNHSGSLKLHFCDFMEIMTQYVFVCFGCKKTKSDKELFIHTQRKCHPLAVPRLFPVILDFIEYHSEDFVHLAFDSDDQRVAALKPWFPFKWCKDLWEKFAYGVKDRNQPYDQNITHKDNLASFKDLWHPKIKEWQQESLVPPSQWLRKLVDFKNTDHEVRTRSQCGIGELPTIKPRLVSLIDGSFIHIKKEQKRDVWRCVGCEAPMDQTQYGAIKHAKGCIGPNGKVFWSVLWDFDRKLFLSKDERQVSFTEYIRLKHRLDVMAHFNYVNDKRMDCLLRRFEALEQTVNGDKGDEKGQEKEENGEEEENNHEEKKEEKKEVEEKIKCGNGACSGSGIVETKKIFSAYCYSHETRNKHNCIWKFMEPTVCNTCRSSYINHIQRQRGFWTEEQRQTVKSGTHFKKIN